MLLIFSFYSFSPTEYEADGLSPDMIDRTISAQVNRDDENPEGGPSDYFNLCDLGRFQGGAVDFVGVFIDTSGSMDETTIQASIDKFRNDLTNANLTISEVGETSEDWISPFLTALAP